MGADKSNVIRLIGKLKDEKTNEAIAKIIEILQKPSSKALKRGKRPKV